MKRRAAEPQISFLDEALPPPEEEDERPVIEPPSEPSAEVAPEQDTPHPTPLTLEPAWVPSEPVTVPSVQAQPEPEAMVVNAEPAPPVVPRTWPLGALADRCRYVLRPDVRWPVGWQRERQALGAPVEGGAPTAGPHCADCPLIGACPFTVQIISRLLPQDARLEAQGAYPLTPQPLSEAHAAYLETVAEHVRSWLERLEENLPETPIYTDSGPTLRRPRSRRSRPR